MSRHCAWEGDGSTSRLAFPLHFRGSQFSVSLAVVMVTSNSMRHGSPIQNSLGVKAKDDSRDSSLPVVRAAETKQTGGHVVPTPLKKWSV